MDYFKDTFYGAFVYFMKLKSLEILNALSQTHTHSTFLPITKDLCVLCSLIHTSFTRD